MAEELPLALYDHMRKRGDPGLNPEGRQGSRELRHHHRHPRGAAATARCPPRSRSGAEHVLRYGGVRAEAVVVDGRNGDAARADPKPVLQRHLRCGTGILPLFVGTRIVMSVFAR